ncbi:MAG: translation initiation factor IF-2, partial [Candidatus Diapherotrites archaeon]|nr:translation initiation factor IF-2 [Candidatus Diapherotrites archaeon]
RALLKPNPLQEIRAPTEKFKVVKEVHAAAGIKVAATGLEDAIPGAPLYVATDDLAEVKERVLSEIKQVEITTDQTGLIVKADALGSLEAIVKLLSDKGIKIRSAGVGNITKKDVAEALSVREKNKRFGVIFAFNVKVEESALESANREKLVILESKVVYSLLDHYEEWVNKVNEEEKRAVLKELILPGKIKILPGCIFRKTKPAIVGVKVLQGSIRPKYPLMKEDGTLIGTIHTIQADNKTLNVLNRGEEAAVSIREPIVVGRHVFEDDVLITKVPRTHIFKLKNEFSNLLSNEEKELLDSIIEIVGGQS